MKATPSPDEVFEMIRGLWSQGLTITEIARRVRLPKRLIAKVIHGRCAGVWDDDQAADSSKKFYAW